MATTKTFTFKTEDELKQMSYDERCSYWYEFRDKLHDFEQEIRLSVDRLNDEYRARSVVNKFRKNYVGKWMYAERGIGNNPTIAYIFNVRLDGDVVVIDMIHYAPDFSRFPIQSYKAICTVENAEKLYDEISANANFYNDDKEYVEDYEACKRLLESSRERTLEMFESATKRAKNAYDMLMDAMNRNDAESVRKNLNKMIADQPLK